MEQLLPLSLKASADFSNRLHLEVAIKSVKLGRLVLALTVVMTFLALCSLALTLAMLFLFRQH
jgi:hypothetical protein